LDVAVVKVPASAPAAPPPRGLLRIVGLAIVLCGAAWTLTACFNPQQPGCAFSCATDGLCPSGYQCETDLLCHRTDGQGSCSVGHVTSDAADDRETSDAAPGGAVRDGSGAQ
jgi:hypothetical protein